MEKFSNAKVGDKVWHVSFGYGEIISINDLTMYPIKAKFNYSDNSWIVETFTASGKECTEDVFPSLFWNKFHIPTDEEDKKPFNLLEFLINNLEQKEFEIGSSNLHLIYSYGDWKRYESRSVEIFTVYFKSINDAVLKELTNQHITPKQLYEAYRTLKWI